MIRRLNQKRTVGSSQRGSDACQNLHPPGRDKGGRGCSSSKRRRPQHHYLSSLPQIPPIPRLYIGTTGSGAILKRARARNAGIRTQYLDYEGQEAKAILVQNAERDEQRKTRGFVCLFGVGTRKRTRRDGGEVTATEVWGTPKERKCLSGYFETARPRLYQATQGAKALETMFRFGKG